jgi:UDP:flavonoid glycosyltransferase YjiC (YdhE family)
MTVLFVPYSTPGHVYPMLPVMAELVGRGVAVRVLVTEAFAGAVREVGAQPVALDSCRDVYVPDRLWGRALGRYVLAQVRRPWWAHRASVRLAAEIDRRRPGCVVVDPMLGWVGRVLRRRGVPSVMFSTTVLCGPSAASSVERGWLAAPWAVRLRPTTRRVGRHRGLTLVHALPQLQPAAETLGPDVHVLGPLIRREAAGPSVRVPRGGRVLYVSAGTVFARGPTFFGAVVAAFGDTGWTVVLATGHTDPAVLGPLPVNVVAHRAVPQLAVLARAEVFLTHAGMNSVMEALVAGVPMALAARSREQRYLAGRLAGLGVGVPVDVLGWPPGRLFGVVSALAEDAQVRAASAGWRARLVERHGPRRAADLIQERLSLAAAVPAGGVGARAPRRGR